MHNQLSGTYTRLKQPGCLGYSVAGVVNEFIAALTRSDQTKYAVVYAQAAIIVYLCRCCPII